MALFFRIMTYVIFI